MKRFVRIFSAVIIFASAVQAVYAEELTLVTMNAWPAVDRAGFINCDEYEPESDRNFRHEILTSGLAELGADIIVLNGLNPVNSLAGMTAEVLGMNCHAAAASAGFRIGPVSLPVNLRAGDAVFWSEPVSAEPAGEMHMNGLISRGGVTLFSKAGVQVIGCRIMIGDSVDESEAGATEQSVPPVSKGFYLFSVVWTESLFDDQDNLEKLLECYTGGRISAAHYADYVADAVEGAEKRVKQAAETLSFINSVAGEDPVVLMGSLNALPGSEELRVLTDAGFIDAFDRAGRGSGYTLDTVSNTSFEKIPDGSPESVPALLAGQYRTDYILYRGGGIIPRTVETVLDEPVFGVFPSKHFGLRAVIEFESTLSSR